MFRVNEIESRHLRQWVKEQKSGTRQHIATLGTLVNLWCKPGTRYQQLRMVAVACTLGTALLQLFFAAAALSQTLGQDRRKADALAGLPPLTQAEAQALDDAMAQVDDLLPLDEPAR